MIPPFKPTLPSPTTFESHPSARKAEPGVNLETLTEKVYQLLLEDLRLQQVRLARPKR
ncbi:hypothetical protein [Deinococcus peraridilitoris]|uniref:Uncharacterized protein n=1 Tax=Deinococcus peraridilitoris (strain DSM 19664 / LMG 22246 / CIP 109416 / KR-200) TaxID=937777 RepID=L0A3Q8_DEIPD|nr:hypothetical protein [Deinococcus peraridilitoris]AFZ67625.1 hypothetical protein Deipe_2135 [Deinococcus peraridilitoris DSM 19664]